MNSLTKQSKQTRSSSLSNSILILFLIGCALGAACFLYTYGVSILNPVYDDWLFNSDMDLRQHYIGFCHYRNSAWTFPIGLIDSLTYQSPVSVIYTDSIPLFAVFFKLLNGLLPVHFQYFGIFGLISFCLMGGLSVLVVRQLLINNKSTASMLIRYNRRGKIIEEEPFVRGTFINDENIMINILSLVCAPVFVLSFTVLQRMFYHTALGAQWIIMLTIYIWLINDRLKSKSLVYALMGVLVIFIHSYYLPMVGMLLLASYADEYVRNKGLKQERKKILTNGIRDIVLYCVAALISLYVLGGFYGENTATAEGLGTFTSNLNTFINPIGYGSLLREQPLYNMFQYEGYAYVGMGMLILMVAGIISVAVMLLHDADKSSDNKDSEKASLKTIIIRHPRWTIGALLIMLSCMLAMFPIVTLNDRKVFGVPYPKLVRSILSIFRSNGRFIWVAMYLLMLGAIVLTYRYTAVYTGRRKVYLIILVAVVLQMADVNNAIAYKQAYFGRKQQYDNLFVNADIESELRDKKYIIFLYNENDIVMDAAFYAYLNDMSLNSYYYARDLDKEINENVEYHISQLKNGIVDENTVYVCKKDEIDNYKNCDINWYELSDHYVGVNSRN